MRRAVVTLAIGPEFVAFGKRTHPFMKRYAQRFGAEFVVIDTPRLSNARGSISWLGWEKYQLADLLEHYEHILYVDTDVFIRPDCPDLFEFCGDRWGAFNEVPHNAQVIPRLEEFCKMAGLPLKRTRDAYYNGGVVVCRSAHRAVFTPPPVLYAQSQFRFAEQTHTTVRLHQLEIACRDLPVAFNAMPGWMAVPGCVETCPVVHLASFPPVWRDRLADRLLERWRHSGFDV